VSQPQASARWRRVAFVCPTLTGPQPPIRQFKLACTFFSELFHISKQIFRKGGCSASKQVGASGVVLYGNRTKHSQIVAYQEKLEQLLMLSAFFTAVACYADPDYCQHKIRQAMRIAPAYAHEGP
jgi:hypothetical protein